MNVQSEKQRYTDELEMLAWKIDAEHIFWGEELCDKHLVLYSTKMNKLSIHPEIKERLQVCAIVVLNHRKQDFMKLPLALVDMETGNIYLSVDLFNGIWKRLRESVKIGMSVTAESGEECPICKPEDIVDLSYIRRRGTLIKIEKDKVCYEPRPLSDEEKRLIGKRQSMLDNPRLYYYYSMSGGDIHDKECEELSSIHTDELLATETYPENRKMCPKCKRKLLLRIACKPHTKLIPLCDRFLQDGKVDNSTLHDLVMTRNVKFKPVTLDEILVYTLEDTWKIVKHGRNRYSLYHNNYAKIGETERYILDGFHNQGLDGESLTKMLFYLAGYTWEKHLRKMNEKDKCKTDKCKKEERCTSSVANKERFIDRVKAWLRKIVGKK